MDSHEELLAALAREEEQDKRIKGYQRQIGWQQGRIQELNQQNATLVEALEAMHQEFGENFPNGERVSVDLARQALALVEKKK